MEDPQSSPATSSSASTSPGTATSSAPEITSAMLEEEIGWHEDNIQIDFMTVDDLRRLLERSGHKIEANIYRESATLVASMVEDSTAESMASLPPTPSSSNGPFTQLVANTFSRTGSFESRPSPSAPTPLTLSLGSWSISEEEFPLYIGSAAGILLLLFVLLSATTWRCLSAGDRKRRRRQEDLEKRLNSPSLLSSNSHVHHISSHDSMVCLSGTRIESRIIDPYGREDGLERNQLLREDALRLSPKPCHGSRIVTDVDDVIGISSPQNSSQMDDMNTYVKLAPVVDNFLASQATFHTFQPSSRLSKKESSDGMSSSKTSPNELDLDESLTAAEMAELQEEARDTFRSLPFPGRRLHSDLFNGNVGSLLSSDNNDSTTVKESSLQSPESYIHQSAPHPASLLFNSNNNNENINNNLSAQTSALEDLYSKVDYNSKLKNRCPHDGVAVVSPLPPHKSPSPSLLSFSKQQTSLCEDDEEVEFIKAPVSGGTHPSSYGGAPEPTLIYNIRTSL